MRPCYPGYIAFQQSAGTPIANIYAENNCRAKPGKHPPVSTAKVSLVRKARGRLFNDHVFVLGLSISSAYTGEGFALLQLFGFKYVDIGLFERSEGLRPSQLIAEPSEFIKQLKRRSEICGLAGC